MRAILYVEISSYLNWDTTCYFFKARWEEYPQGYDRKSYNKKIPKAVTGDSTGLSPKSR